MTTGQRLTEQFTERGMTALAADIDEEIAKAVDEKREQIIALIKNGSFLHDDAPTARFAKEVIAAIRREC